MLPVAVGLLLLPSAMENNDVQTQDAGVEQLLAKATRTRPWVHGLLLEDTPRRRQEWGEELYRAAARISLTPAQYEKIQSHYEALQKILDGGNDALLNGAHIFVQGSIRSRTTILPAPNATGEHREVDADAIIWLPHASGAALETFYALERRLREGTRTQRQPSRKNRCVRLHYQDESPPFHLDATPARNAVGNSSTNGEGALLVPDLQTGGWKSSAPKAYSDWFAEACDAALTLAADEALLLEEREELLAKSTQEPLPDHESYVDFNPLRAAVKLLKAHRDMMFVAAPVCDLRPISIIITTLAAHAYKQIARESVITPRTAVNSLIEIVERMPRFVKGPPGARVISNPVISSENFAEKWQGANGTALEAAFYEWHREASVAVRLGLWRFSSRETLSEAMRRSFGTRAAGSQAGPTAALPLVTATPNKSARAAREQFIDELFPVALTRQLKIDCEVRKSTTLIGKLRSRRLINRWLPYGRQLRFFVSSCNAPLPYDLYWKVRNVGPAAERRKEERGEIELDKGNQSREERTTFSGEHYVEAYVVKNGICVAQDRIQVPIESQ